MFEKFAEQVHAIGIIPVVKIDDASKAEALAGALIKGGIPAAEVTFRTDAAEEAIKRISKAYPEMLVGAGTVLSVENADKAVKAGAKFIVSPGFDEEVVDWCIAHNVPVSPGLCTPSEIQKGLKRGLTVMKFFPAEASGGVGMLKNFAGPFANVRFMPTGGINLSNLAEYAKCPNVISVGGTWMVKADLINNEKWDEITQMCLDAEKALQGLTLVHVGINTKDQKSCDALAADFNKVGMAVTKAGKSSTFMDGKIEIMNHPFYGTNGHLGYSCYDVDRTMAYLSRLGFHFIPESIIKDAKGTKVVYLKEEIGGFAIHLVRA